MPFANITVTAKTGPGITNTAQVFNGVAAFTVDVAGSVLTIHKTGGETEAPLQEYDLTGVTTFTVVIAAGNYTVTVS